MGKYFTRYYVHTEALTFLMILCTARMYCDFYRPAYARIKNIAKNLSNNAVDHYVTVCVRKNLN